MNIFLGSSTESIPVMKEIAIILEKCGVKPIKWDKPGFIAPGQFTLEALIHTCKNTDAAIFIYAEDDKTWYRDEWEKSPRDNVIFEHGLFTGSMGRNKAIVVLHNKPKLSTDLKGLQYIYFSDDTKETATAEIENWVSILKFNKNNVKSSYNHPKVSLEEYFNRIKKENDKPFYITNDNRFLKLSNSSELKNFINRDYTSFHSIVPLEEEVEYEFNHYNEFYFPQDVDFQNLIDLKIVMFEINIGDFKCDIKSATIIEVEETNGKRISIHFKDILLKIKEETYCVIKFKIPVPNHENVEIFTIRYPTKGFSLRLEYMDELFYQYQWFKTNSYVGPNSNIQKLDAKFNNGFHTYTNDWMLIGEGITAGWF